MAPVETFAGELADNYAKFRRGYRQDVIEHLAEAFVLGEHSKVLDLGCGTGQLARPLAAKAGAVLGMDPSADMLTHAQAGTPAANVVWLLGSDETVPALEPLLGKESLDLVTIGTALHWMDPAALFVALRRLLRPDGGVAIIANGTPLWLHRTAWARALTEVATKWFGELSFPSCGTSDQERARYRELLATSGFSVEERRFDYDEELSLDDIIGAFYSAAPLHRLDAEQRAGLHQDLRVELSAARPDGRFVETVHVPALVGRVAA